MSNPEIQRAFDSIRESALELNLSALDAHIAATLTERTISGNTSAEAVVAAYRRVLKALRAGGGALVDGE